MIGGKLMRLSLMLVKSLVFNFLRERDRQFLVFPFFAPFLHPFYSLFAHDLHEKIKKMRVKVKINVCRFAYNKINAYLCNVIKK